MPSSGFCTGDSNASSESSDPPGLSPQRLRNHKELQEASRKGSKWLSALGLKAEKRSVVSLAFFLDSGFAPASPRRTVKDHQVTPGHSHPSFSSLSVNDKRLNVARKVLSN